MVMRDSSLRSHHSSAAVRRRDHARATIAFFNPRRLAICIAHALSQDHFLANDDNDLAWVEKPHRK